MQPKLKLHKKLNDIEDKELRYPRDPSDVDKSPDELLALSDPNEKPERLKETDYIKFERSNKPTPVRDFSGKKIIYLFVPPQSLNYTRSYNYAEEAQSFVSANESIKNVLDSNKGAIDKIIKSFGAAYDDLKRAATSGALGSQPTSQIAGKLGFAFNPNMEIYFKQPNFRNFEFTFPFLPKTPEEAKIVEDIVSEFEKYSMPKINTAEGSFGKNIYEYPNVWKISTKSKIGGGFNSNTCVLESFNVNYGADAGYTTFIDGKPVMTTLKLSFKEIVLWSQDDHPYESKKG